MGRRLQIIIRAVPSAILRFSLPGWYRPRDFAREKAVTGVFCCLLLAGCGSGEGSGRAASARTATVPVTILPTEAGRISGFSSTRPLYLESRKRILVGGEPVEVATIRYALPQPPKCEKHLVQRVFAESAEGVTRVALSLTSDGAGEKGCSETLEGIANPPTGSFQIEVPVGSRIVTVRLPHECDPEQSSSAEICKLAGKKIEVPGT
jgi:hypothetical protein